MGNAVGFDQVAGYLSIGFFGLCAVVFVIMLLPGSSFLRLDEDGFTFSSLFRPHTLRWDEIESFFPVRLGVVRGQVTAGWNFLPGREPHKNLTNMNKVLSGAHAALPQNYAGKSAGELAALMNEWLNHARQVE